MVLNSTHVRSLYGWVYEVTGVCGTHVATKSPEHVESEKGWAVVVVVEKEERMAKLASEGCGGVEGHTAN